MERYPDYNRSLLSLASSVLAHYGAVPRHSTLPELDGMLAENPENVVVMLFDGMGTAILEKHLSEDSFLRRSTRGTLSSVFPPTTTAATVSLESGLSPAEHGWLGWSLYFEEIGENVSIFPNTVSGGRPAADYHVARRYLPFKSVVGRIEETGNARAFHVSPFSDYHSKSVMELCGTVRALCAGKGRKYIYTYWHQPDYDMHDLGTQDAGVTADIAEIDREVSAMCDTLSDALVVVTADHGLVDTEWRYLRDHPDIVENLSRAPSIESRAMSFFVKPGHGARFEKAFANSFGDCYRLFTHDQALALFGEGTPHPRTDGFVGDYLAAATGRVSIDASPAPSGEPFKAAHAGLTSDEMNVPFIVIQKRRKG